MNLHEYQAKELLRRCGVAVPEGIVVERMEDVLWAVSEIQQRTGTDKWVVKAQVHAGGRGKAGGIQVARKVDEVRLHVKKLLGTNLVTAQTDATGKPVKKILIEQNIYYEGAEEPKEFYLSMMLDRQAKQHVIIYSPAGGMDIETIAHESPELIFKEYIHPLYGLYPFQCRRIAFHLGLSGQAFHLMVDFLMNLYKAYQIYDCTLLEINPLIKTSDSKIYAADCKMVIDDNALYRQAEIAQMRDVEQENPIEVKARSWGLNYIKMDGNVGCMVNGAGLAMATMDIIQLAGARPANFLDVGGSANAQRVEQGFRIILEDPEVKAILVNIFGGIVRCDRVAMGIVEAYKNIGNINVPIIVRLQGTNAEEARTIITESGLDVFYANTLTEAAQLVKEKTS